MATPHISAEKGDFAKTVLMPGDPLRAKFIAETFLTDAVEVTTPVGFSAIRVYIRAKGFLLGSRHGLPFHRYLQP